MFLHRIKQSTTSLPSVPTVVALSRLSALMILEIIFSHSPRFLGYEKLSLARYGIVAAFVDKLGLVEFPDRHIPKTGSYHVPKGIFYPLNEEGGQTKPGWHERFRNVLL